jgi:hypothetical protein
LREREDRIVDELVALEALAGSGTEPGFVSRSGLVTGASDDDERVVMFEGDEALCRHQKQECSRERAMRSRVEYRLLGRTRVSVIELCIPAMMFRPGQNWVTGMNPHHPMGALDTEGARGCD